MSINRVQLQVSGRTINGLMAGLLTILLVAFTNKSLGQTNDFEVKVDSFLKKYSADFSQSGDRYSHNSNDFVLDKKVKSNWNMVVTLKSKTSFVNHYKQTVYQRLYLGFYQFNSPNDCKAALDSLLNCFGADCQEIKLGEKGQTAKTPPVFYLVNEKEIVVCHIACEHINEFWTRFKHDLKTTFGSEASFIIESGCGGQIEFNKF